MEVQYLFHFQEHTYSPMAFYMVVDCLTGYAIMKDSLAEAVVCVSWIDLGALTGFFLSLFYCTD